MNIKSFCCFVLCSLLSNTVFSQNVASELSIGLKWAEFDNIERPIIINSSLSKRDIKDRILPAINNSIETKDRAILQFYDFEYEPFSGFNSFKSEELSQLTEDFEYSIYHTLQGNTIFTGYYLCPFKKVGGTIYKLTSYKVKVLKGQAFSLAQGNSTAKRAASNSVLANGTWLKFSVTGNSIYKITYAQLKDAGVDVDNIDPRTIKIYGHHGGMLPEANAVKRPDDIPENAIMVTGENDGKFDVNDQVVFYAQGPNKWKYNSMGGRYYHETNIYSDKSYYFLTFGGSNGKRIAPEIDGNSLNADVSFNWFDDFILHEQDLENICSEGRTVHGERFDQKLQYFFNYNLQNIENKKDIRFYYEVGGLAPVSSTMLFKVNNVLLNTNNFGSLIDPKDVCFLNSGVQYANTSPIQNLQISFQYNQPTSSSRAWLDYFEIHFTRQLKYYQSFMEFRNIDSKNDNIVEYRLQNLPNSFSIFNITDPMNVKLQEVFTEGNERVFRTSSDGTIKEYALTDGNYAIPTYEGKVENQNLHATGIKQYIVISAPEFLDAANKIAAWHQTRDNMDVLVVTPQQIYNEFSSGSQDISAIRDYLKHVYYGNTNPVNQLKNVLLMGDASFDYKDKIANNTNFVPVYESDPKMLIPRNNYWYYCSDDFYGFLDSTDGSWNNDQKLEISIGRLPVKTAAEANALVDKIIHYKKPESLGEWRNFVTLCADDADEEWEKDFVRQFETIYHFLDTSYTNLNVRKVYLDAFKQVNLSGSQRYPEAKLAVKKEFEQGTFVFNYIGHGGEEYLATEKVIDIPLINDLNNINSLPAFFTATCEFSRFDDAKRKSAGEYVITNPKGGAIAMFTTTRVVTSDANFFFTLNFWQNCLYNKIGGKWPTLGDVYKSLKNWNSQSDNDRKFSMFGDPALTLNYPEYTIKIDSVLVNGLSDTIKALDKVTMKGHVEDISGNKLTWFNGKVYPIVYDKASDFLTLSNDLPNQPMDFELYSNILYKGQSSVNAGDYAFTFVVPKDINYNFGEGKISLYADNGTIDASGNKKDIIIGGASSNSASDVQGPEIQLFIDDYSFVSGGMTDQSPLLLAKIYDENGINTSGIGIGRDIIATIDKGTENEKKYNLNAFYKAELNSYTSGDISYQLEGLGEGVHTYTLKVWDVYNNSSEVTIEFVVKNNQDLVLQHVLNYPNPFSTNTEFHFDHNHEGENLKVVINIYTISGKVIKSIVSDISNAPGHVSQISWNGRDDYDDKPSKGVYIYRLTVTTEDGKKAEVVEKLVILN